ncbi:MAG TPA: PKD domain-containing protein [Longimicrobiales bacterium]|nr:PKD domain-containing protein [Longimicrobiales bacterium]
MSTRLGWHIAIALVIATGCVEDPAAPNESTSPLRNVSSGIEVSGIPLGVPADAQWFAPSGMNDARQIVGRGRHLCMDDKGRTLTVDRAYLWQNGQFTDLGTLAPANPCAYVYARAINNSGVVVGYALGAQPVNELAAFVYDNNGIRKLKQATGSDVAVDINDAGVIVGYARKQVDAGSILVQWTNGVPMDLGADHDLHPEAIAINNGGAVLGSYHGSGSGYGGGFLIKNGTFTQLPSNFRPVALSDDDIVVGSMGGVGAEVPAIWENGQLTEVFPPSEYYLQPTSLFRAVDINASGQILVMAFSTFQRLSDGATFAGTLLVDNGSITQLSAGISNHPGHHWVEAALNSVGDVVGSAGTTGQTYLWTAPVPSNDPGATPVGANIEVRPLDLTTGERSPVSLTFSNVTGGGTTAVTSGTMGVGSGPPPPSGFRLGSPKTYFEITTTATFSGPVTVCIDYTGTAFGNENLLKLLHGDGSGNWTDVTTSRDTQINIICGTVESFSPFLVAEENAAPTVNAIALPTGPLAVNTAATVSASFTDANPLDVHTAIIDWGDGTTPTAVMVSELYGSGTLSSSHMYGAAGVYTVQVTVNDGDLTGSRSSALDNPAYVVVYDPNGGFVTGGGWIDSPAGAYIAEPALTGRVSFGFVSRYHNGARTPSGRTDFQFRAANLTFRSSSYEWLVVSGARAQFKGAGIINGADDYGFMLTAIDGELDGGGGTDRFRLKIWDRVTDAIVYDSGLGAADDTSPATPLGGGSIVIHRK